MTVVQLNTVFGSGSTGRIAASLRRLAEEDGFESLAAWGRGPGPAERGVPGFRSETATGFLAHVAIGFAGLGGFGSRRATERLLAWLDQRRPDLLHLHNLHGFWVDVERLFDWIRRRDVPVVWTLHDAWPLTGHCAFFGEARCDRWKSGCGACPVHRRRYPYSVLRDRSAAAWSRKRAAFAGVRRLVLASPSRFLADVARESFLGPYPVEVVPNGVDLSVFRPDGPAPADAPEPGRRVVLGAAGVWEARKGLRFFPALARSLGPDVLVAVVGTTARDRALLRLGGPLPANLLLLPRLADPAALAAWYRRADAFANPTLDDNFPTTNLEALACGTPVAVFDAGGAAEALAPGCGEAVPPGDAAALAAAVGRLLRADRPAVRAACRARAEGAFDGDACLRRYLAIYRRLV